MSDQGKWFKLWESALNDQDLENLDLDNWARWARMGLYMKKHGNDGRLVIKYPGRALQTVLRVGDFEAVLRIVKLLPGYYVEEIKNETVNVTVASVSFSITSQNWAKFQGDFSSDRVRKFRRRETANETPQEEKRREETRREEITPSAPNGAAGQLIKLFHVKLATALREKPAHFNGGALGRLFKAALATHTVARDRRPNRLLVPVYRPLYRLKWL
jgi:hypothetical protein